MNLHKITLFFFSVLLSFCFPALAWREVGNGGNGYIAEFFSIYDQLITLDKEVCYSSLTGGKMPEDLLKNRWKLRVKTRPVVMKDGEKVGALNYPDQDPPQLSLSEEFWKNAARSQKVALVLHEILYLAHFDDGNMSFSGPIFSCIEARHQEADMDHELVKWAFRECKPQILDSLAPTDIEPILKMEPDTQFPLRNLNLLEVSLNGLCVAGIKALDRTSALSCSDGWCKDWLCTRADEVKPSVGYNWTRAEILDFLEVMLKDYDKQTKISSCGWSVCDSAEMAPLFERLPNITKQCNERKLRLSR